VPENRRSSGCVDIPPPIQRFRDEAVDAATIGILLADENIGRADTRFCSSVVEET